MKTAHVATLFAALFAVVVWVGCDDEEECFDCGWDWCQNIGSIQIITGEPDNILYYSLTDSATTTITVIVTNSCDQPYPGQVVNVTLSDSSLGVVELVDPDQGDTTNSMGRVNMIYRCYARPGYQVIFASSGGVTENRSLLIRSFYEDPFSMNVEAEPVHLIACPTDTVQSLVTIDIQDGLGNRVPNDTIRVSTTGGTFPQTVLTDSNGFCQFPWTFRDEFGTFQLFTRYEGWGLRDTIDVEVTHCDSVTTQ